MAIVPATDGIRDSGSGIRRLVALGRGYSGSAVEEPPIAVPGSIRFRIADVDDAPAIHSLIVEHLAEGHLLPREIGEVAAHAHRFVVAVHGEQIAGCAELAPLSATIAEVRSMIVRPEARSLGVGQRIIDDLDRRAAAAGFLKLCAFTHSPGYFVKLGFSIVPHDWLPEKIRTDCRNCVHFRRCGQYAVVRPLERSLRRCVPLAALHG